MDGLPIGKFICDSPVAGASLLVAASFVGAAFVAAVYHSID